MRREFNYAIFAIRGERDSPYFHGLASFANRVSSPHGVKEAIEDGNEGAFLEDGIHPARN